MDAVSLTGVWLDFPALVQAVRAGNGLYVAGLYQMLEEEARRRGDPHSPIQAPHRSLLEKMEKRLIQEHEDDLATILAL